MRDNYPPVVEEWLDQPVDKSEPVPREVMKALLSEEEYRERFEADLETKYIDLPEDSL